MSFTNSQLFNDALPKIDDVILKPISKQYIKIILVNKFVMYALFFGILIVGKYVINKVVFQEYFWHLFFVTLVFCVLNFSIAILSFKKRKYAIREQDVIYAQGLLVNSITTVPISRIQHIEESRSWIARKFNLATLNIFTAGESGSDLSIKGLPHEEARQINDFLSAKVNGNS